MVWLIFLKYRRFGKNREDENEEEKEGKDPIRRISYSEG